MACRFTASAARPSGAQPVSPTHASPSPEPARYATFCVLFAQARPEVGGALRSFTSTIFAQFVRPPVKKSSRTRTTRLNVEPLGASPRVVFGTDTRSTLRS